MCLGPLPRSLISELISSCLHTGGGGFSRQEERRTEIQFHVTLPRSLTQGSLSDPVSKHRIFSKVLNLLSVFKKRISKVRHRKPNSIRILEVDSVGSLEQANSWRQKGERGIQGPEGGEGRSHCVLGTELKGWRRRLGCKWWLMLTYPANVFNAIELCALRNG